MSTTRTAPGLAQRFALILEGLCAAAAARMARPRTLRERLAAPLLMLLWSRLRRISARFSALANDPAPPSRLRVRRRRQAPGGARRLPRGVAWLVRLVPEAAGFGSQLQHLLSDPAMADLLQSNPQVARMLRPLCRMLAVPAAAIPPPVPHAAPPGLKPPHAAPPADEPSGEGPSGRPQPLGATCKLIPQSPGGAWPLPEAVFSRA